MATLDYVLPSTSVVQEIWVMLYREDRYIANWTSTSTKPLQEILNTGGAERG